MDVRAEAVRYFEMGFAERAVGRLLGIPRNTVGKWLYAYRALGKEALFVTTHRKYDHETKVRAARAVVEGGMAKPDAMEAFGLKSMTQINDWCRLYREGGPDALLPKPKGRPRKPEPAFSSREEELEARVLALPQNQPNAPLYPAGGAPGSRPGALPHFGRPRYLGPPPRARSTAG